MAERPFDCSECKRPISVCYTEIVGDKMTRTVMCADCPHLERKLHGLERREMTGQDIGASSLVCGDCGTTLEEVRTGHALGCPLCYEVFNDVLVDALLKEGRVSRHLTTNKKTMPLHVGRKPGEVTEISPTLKLIALNEALDEMLIKEDYEQAAWLRDQIKTLKDKAKQGDEGDEGKK